MYSLKPSSIVYSCLSRAPLCKRGHTFQGEEAGIILLLESAHVRCDEILFALEAHLGEAASSRGLNLVS
jgi:hypothetical protein